MADIVLILGLIGSIYTAWRFYRELKKPVIEKESTIITNSERIERHEKALEALEDSAEMLLNDVLALLNLAATGAGDQESFVQMRDELRKFIAEKAVRR